MLLQILSQTPPWVFLLFAALLGLGASQLRRREVALGRVLGIAAGMVAFSLYGTIAAFGASRHTLPLALGAWFAGAALTLLWTRSRAVPPGTRYHAGRRRFTLPGSALPLVLMMAIFFTKYAVAVTLALTPALATALPFVAAACLLYGCASGAFAGRAARLWRLAHRARQQTAAPVVAGAAAVATQARP